MKELFTLRDTVTSYHHGQDELSHAALLKLQKDLAQAQQTVGDMLQMRTPATEYIADVPHMPDGMASVETSRRIPNLIP